MPARPFRKLSGHARVIASLAALEVMLPALEDDPFAVADLTDRARNALIAVRGWLGGGSFLNAWVTTNQAAQALRMAGDYLPILSATSLTVAANLFSGGNHTRGMPEHLQLPWWQLVRRRLPVRDPAHLVVDSIDTDDLLSHLDLASDIARDAATAVSWNLTDDVLERFRQRVHPSKSLEWNPPASGAFDALIDAIVKSRDAELIAALATSPYGYVKRRTFDAIRDHASDIALDIERLCADAYREADVVRRFVRGQPGG